MKTEIEHCRHFDAEKCERKASCQMINDCAGKAEQTPCVMRMCHGCIKTWEIPDETDDTCECYEA